MRTKSMIEQRAAHAALVVTALLASGTLGGCMTNTAKRDFYAMRNVRLRSVQGDLTVIVRADPTDLLTRERRALALGSAD